MALNYRTLYLDDSSVVTVFEAPKSLTRVFFGIYVVARQDAYFNVHISFDDPRFTNYLCITEYKMNYEFSCEYIPQGIIFVKKVDTAPGWISAIEILK